MTASVQLQDVTFAYRSGHPVLGGVSLTVERGTFLAVAGPNGAGKSTLLNLLAGLLVPQSGTISIEAANIRSYRQRDLARKVAVVRQESIPPFGFSVAETVMMARTPHYGHWGFETQADRELVAEALDATDTAPFAWRPLADLSGGERQRVFIARALAQDTPILLLDEPTSFLDLKHQVEIYDLLKSVQRDRGRTIIAITHDINLAAQYCDRALMLQRYQGPEASAKPVGSRASTGQCRIGPPGAVFTSAGIEEAFGVRVFAAPIGRESVFLPLGRLARDAGKMDLQPAPENPSPPPVN
ncbi:MAG: ABC transporter ATP-binding protein [Phycisphaerales bacterium]|nr:MAG: ABC transporter ATP-binding protein [Phycisphaerales bacterium]